MSSPDPVLSPIPVGNIAISRETAVPAAAALAPCPHAANEEFACGPAALPQPPGEPDPSARVPLSAWLSLAFWAIGTAVLFSLGVAYRLLA